MSVKIIEQVLFKMINIPETNNWFVSDPKREGFSKVKYYEYHIEYKDEKDYEQNFTKYNEDFVSGLKQLGLSEEKISKIPLKIICKKYNDKTPTTFREWKKTR